MGARAVLYTDIARDGTGEGPNVEATATLARAVPGLEVIASGGIGSLAHLQALAARPEIASCVVGRALYDGSLTVREAIAAGRGAA
jgi:phosphoribosylformimino-5-aminoimidazole carboxamide ribotide isomerase